MEEKEARYFILIIVFIKKQKLELKIITLQLIPYTSKFKH